MGKTSGRGRGEAVLGDIQCLVLWSWAGWLSQDCALVFAGTPAQPWALGVPQGEPPCLWRQSSITAPSSPCSVRSSQGVHGSFIISLEKGLALP